MRVPSHWIDGAGAPLIFVHGNASAHSIWSGVIESLRREFLCITYDLYGHGGAAAPAVSAAPALDVGPDRTLSIEALVDELECLRSELKIEQMYLVGHSLGALVAAEYAVAFPGRLLAMGLLAAPAARTAGEVGAAAQLLAQIKSQGMESTLTTLAEHWYTDDYVRRHPTAITERLRQIADMDEALFIRNYELYNATEIAPGLSQIGTPTLVMTGEHARGCGAEVARRLAGRLAHAELLIFAGLKNGILTEIPERVAAGLSQFFARQRAANEQRAALVEDFPRQPASREAT